jgi:exonuclease I
MLHDNKTKYLLYMYRADRWGTSAMNDEYSRLDDLKEQHFSHKKCELLNLFICCKTVLFLNIVK